MRVFPEDLPDQDMRFNGPGQGLANELSNELHADYLPGISS